jgi:hypothetical protein
VKLKEAVFYDEDMTVRKGWRGGFFNKYFVKRPVEFRLWRNGFKIQFNRFALVAVRNREDWRP